MTGTRVDVFVSPAKVLTGQDVHGTHLFLYCMVQAAKCPTAEVSWNRALSQVNRIGDVELYQISLAARNAIAKIQAIVRGKLARMQRVHVSLLTTPISENSGRLICEDKSGLSKNRGYSIQAGEVVDRKSILITEKTDENARKSSTLNGGNDVKDCSDMNENQLNNVPLELQEGRQDGIAQTQAHNSVLSDLDHGREGEESAIQAGQASIPVLNNIVPLVPNLIRKDTRKSLPRIEPIDPVENEADVGSKNNEIRTLRAKYSARIKGAKKLELQLAEKEVSLEQREGKLVKLADKLRRREANLILEKKKMRFANLEKKNREATQLAETSFPRVTMKNGPSMSHIILQKKMKEMESRLIEREQELTRKEKRMETLSDNLRRQHDRLWVKQKIIENTKARNVLKFSIQCEDQSSNKSGLTQGCDQPLDHGHLVNQNGGSYNAGSLISQRPRTNKEKSVLKKSSTKLVLHSLEKMPVKEEQRYRKRLHQETNTTNQKKSQQNPFDTSQPRDVCKKLQQNLQAAQQVKENKRFHNSKVNTCLHDQIRQRETANQMKKKVLHDLYQNRVKGKEAHPEGQKQANDNIFTNPEIKEVEGTKSFHEEKVNKPRQLVQNNDRNDFDAECDLTIEEPAERKGPFVSSCREREKTCHGRQRRQSVRTVTKSQASSMYQSYRFSFEKARPNFEQIYVDTVDAPASKVQPLDENFGASVKAALQRCSAVNIL